MNQPNSSPPQSNLLAQNSFQDTSKINTKTKWTSTEDGLLIKSIEKNGTNSWPMVASEVRTRNGKQCRERWLNQLCPHVNKENWLQKKFLQNL
jgi:hypothetical protein